MCRNIIVVIDPRTFFLDEFEIRILKDRSFGNAPVSVKRLLKIWEEVNMKIRPEYLVACYGAIIFQRWFTNNEFNANERSVGHLIFSLRTGFHRILLDEEYQIVDICSMRWKTRSNGWSQGKVRQNSSQHSLTNGHLKKTKYVYTFWSYNITKCHLREIGYSQLCQCFQEIIYLYNIDSITRSYINRVIFL